MIKKHLFYLLLGVITLNVGCLKNNDADVTPVVAPQGKFSGQFIRVHLNPVTKVKDTVKLTLGVELTGSAFKITGDTTKHAGSFGSFSYNQSYIQWVDNTVPTGANSINLPKYHLHGLYEYNYDQTSFKFQAYNDTLLYFYDLKKTAN